MEIQTEMNSFVINHFSYKCLIFKAIKAFFFILLKKLTFILHVILHAATIDTYDSSL